MSKLLDNRERSARGAAIWSEVTAGSPRDPSTPVAASWCDFVFAEVWNRPGLDRRSRYLIAIAGSVITADEDAIVDGYIRGALQSSDLTLPELREGALHLAVYAGWGRGQRLDNALSRVAETLAIADETYPPIRGTPWDPGVRLAEGRQNFADVMTFPTGHNITPFTEAIANFVFGEMWRRPGLDERARRWLTLVSVCESDAITPYKSHIYAAMTSGNCKPDELHEFVLQYGIHAGWPKASIVQMIVFEMIQKVEAGLSWDN